MTGQTSERRFVIVAKKRVLKSHFLEGTAKHPVENVKEHPNALFQNSFPDFKIGGFTKKMSAESQ